MRGSVALLVVVVRCVEPWGLLDDDDHDDDQQQQRWNGTFGGPPRTSSSSRIRSLPLEARRSNRTMASSRRLLERRRIRMRRVLADSSSVSSAPLYMGIGTHYANAYVGSPPQRVSVIVDTGSHHTAFPCSGCKNCGRHTDPYFDPEKSSSLRYLRCDECLASARCVSRRCQVSQSYTEGSSWKAFQMRDSYYVGGSGSASSSEAGEDEASEEWLKTEFVFGCQTYETGLFRTQKADGIMGMSMHSQTLVPTMRANGRLSHNSFSLCFKQGGGALTLGGVDARLHKKDMAFTPLAKNSGWFTVKLLDLLMNGKSIGVPSSVFASGKGTIVDSGTTDTYLPRRASEKFKKAWADCLQEGNGQGGQGGGAKYSNAKLTYSAEVVKKFPVLTFVFENDLRVDVKPSAYVEQAGGKFIPRVYLTEASGTVLGANFMQDHDIFFDAENKRLGIADARCDYEAPKAVDPGAPQQQQDNRQAPNLRGSPADDLVQKSVDDGKDNNVDSPPPSPPLAGTTLEDPAGGRPGEPAS